MLPYLTASETSLQSLQYQIINRYFPSNATINIWYNDNSANCNYCNKEDTIEHVTIYRCYGRRFVIWWNIISECKIKFGALDVIFGIMNENNDDLIYVLNYCILFCKHFIYKCKSQVIPCNLDSFISKLKKRVEVEKYIAMKNGNIFVFERKWNIMLNS